MWRYGVGLRVTDDMADGARRATMTTSTTHIPSATWPFVPFLSLVRGMSLEEEPWVCQLAAKQYQVRGCGVCGGYWRVHAHGSRCSD